MLTGVKQRIQLEARDWLAHFLGVRRLERQLDELKFRVEMLEHELTAHNEKDAVPLHWAARTYTD